MGIIIIMYIEVAFLLPPSSLSSLLFYLKKNSITKIFLLSFSNFHIFGKYIKFLLSTSKRQKANGERFLNTLWIKSWTWSRERYKVEEEEEEEEEEKEKE